MVDSKVDRANVYVDSSSLLNGTVLWQNTWECHKCSWIRSRGLDGKFLDPIISQATAGVKNVTILLDTRWKQRFRLSLENDTDISFASKFNSKKLEMRVILYYFFVTTHNMTHNIITHI